VTALREYAISLLLVTGALVVALAALGVLRMPDLYSRLHAASKAAALGVLLLALAVVLYFEDSTIRVRAVAFGLILFIAAPISTHLIARAWFVPRAEDERPGGGSIHPDG